MTKRWCLTSWNSVTAIITVVSCNANASYVLGRNKSIVSSVVDRYKLTQATSLHVDCSPLVPGIFINAAGCRNNRIRTHQPSIFNSRKRDYTQGHIDFGRKPRYSPFLQPVPMEINGKTREFPFLIKACNPALYRDSSSRSLPSRRHGVFIEFECWHENHSLESLLLI